jgi:hypothetical protein
MATLATPIEDAATLFDPNAVKLVRASDGDALYFSRAPIPWPRDAFAPTAHDARRRPLAAPHRPVRVSRRFPAAFTALPPGTLERMESLEQLRVLEAASASPSRLSPEPFPPGVDTPEDLARAEARWRCRQVNLRTASHACCIAPIPRIVAMGHEIVERGDGTSLVPGFPSSLEWLNASAAARRTAGWLTAIAFVNIGRRGRSRRCTTCRPCARAFRGALRAFAMHVPRFDHERDPRRAIKRAHRHGVTLPLALDADWVAWQHLGVAHGRRCCGRRRRPRAGAAGRRRMRWPNSKTPAGAAGAPTLEDERRAVRACASRDAAVFPDGPGGHAAIPLRRRQRPPSRARMQPCRPHPARVRQRRCGI